MNTVKSTITYIVGLFACVYFPMSGSHAQWVKATGSMDGALLILHKFPMAMEVRTSLRAHRKVFMFRGTTVPHGAQ
jgi:hypothetical protein